MLVERDITAFLEADWDGVQDDFAEDRFVGHSGPSVNPDHWRIGFPSLRDYREEWIRQAGAFDEVHLKNIEKKEFLYRAIVLRDIEINGEHAIAHKKFDGRAQAVNGSDVVLQWQTMYWLQRISGKWKITGFLGYLPNPMPHGGHDAAMGTICIPDGATQHKAAGPYSPVLEVKSSNLVVLSGQGPIGPDGAILGQTIQEQAELTLENCKRQLAAAGAGFADVFKVMVYLGDMAEWELFNDVYRRYLHPPYPARTAVQAVLWGDIKVEIDMWAISR